MTRRRGARRHRAGRWAAAAVLLGLSAAAAPASPRPPRPALQDRVRLAQGMKAPADDAAPDADAAPPAALPRGASLGMAQVNTGGAALNFSSAAMSFPTASVTAPQSSAATPQGSSAAPGIAPAAPPEGSAAVPGAGPATGAPPGARFGAGPLRAPGGGKGAADADAGPPDALPSGARFGTAQLTFTDAAMGFAASHLATASSHLATPSAAAALPGSAALPGGMAFREEGRGLRVTLDADVLFDFDRAELRRDAGPRLQRLMEEVSARIPRPAFRVEGHTDWIGSDAYNLRLSARRADSVRDWLVRQGGVPRPAVSTVGYGEGRPVAPNSTPEGRDDPEGRQRNRRVELLVTPR